ncbi:hypothetical protein GTV32_15240 [Gordonia sp. SID5947]|uniref:hypothetical protein n=1 Tax=Gordonia sp. SID5947 TaxID=2690315 RepID=UPI001369835D|nr:hypothetical protein [Gordonia sp. SID5947]MYR07575.1 hypothetical protein [Gordonia sp. SID5947]
MGSVFGVIGADFMAVASLVTNNHNHQVTEIGERYTSVGRAVMGVSAGYTEADAENGRHFAGASTRADGESRGARTASGLDPSSKSLTREQVATIIIDRGKKMGMSEDEIKSALATGIVESNLQNLDHGDRDSVGVFQQRNFEPWTVNGRSRTNVDDAATSYYEQLRHTSGSPGDRAQQVQRSALPDRYAQELGAASTLYHSLTSAGVTGARPPAPTRALGPRYRSRCSRLRSCWRHCRRCCTPSAPA